MGKKPPEGDGNARFFSVDEVREAQGLPPETTEEREARRVRSAASAEKLRLREVAEAEARALRVEELRRAAEAARTETTLAVDAALQAEHVGDFQRAAVHLVPRLRQLSEGQRKALGAKFDTMMMRTGVGGTTAEITAMNVIGEQVRRWRQPAEERQMFRISKKAEEPAEEPKKPVPTPWENVLALLPSWMRKK